MNDKSRHNSPDFGGGSLSERQQLLLVALYDGECGPITRWRAQRLVARNPAASEFIESLHTLSDGIEEYASSAAPRLERSLWEGISRRIEQEQRAALYLGERVVSSRQSSVSKGPFAPFGWSMAGGLVAAGFTLFFLGNIQSSDVGRQFGATPEIARKQSGVPVKYVSQSNDLPRIIERNNGPVSETGSYVSVKRQPRVDVDWVHSDGSVRFFSDPSQRSTMIWVKKRSPAVRFYTPPTPRSSLADGSTPQLLEKPIPQSFSVSNR